VFTALRILVVVNPVAGRTKAETIIDALQRQLKSSQGQLEFYETKSDEPVGDIVRQAIEDGIDRVYAVGGDGTVSEVVDGMALSGVPLGIIPAGTGNVVAQELGIPLNFEKACQMLASTSAVKEVDAIQVGEQFFILAVGTGIDAQVMESVSRERKRRYGPLAYAWSTMKVILGMQPRRFTIIADGKPFQMRAAVVLLSNVGTLTRPLRWGPHIKPDDGRIDINIIRGKHLLDYLLAAYDVLPGGPRRTAHIRRLHAYESVVVYADKTLRVQGDGDLIGQTPLEARVVPGAIKVLVPQK
jgi:YegS/Rv2252/BmrU family lipid kinase